jgi:hypothetical protein
MNTSSKASLDKAKEEVFQALEKIKQISLNPHLPHINDDKSRRIKNLIAETEKRL